MANNAKNIVYFDLETQKSFDEVGGRNKMRDLLMSVGVTFSTASNSYEIFDERRVNDLVRTLLRADLVVGFNVLGFDYEVLAHYTLFDLRQVPTLDLMADIEKTLGRRIGLDALAAATLGCEKTAEGLQAVRWFKEGKLMEIAEYCCYDVKITRLLHEYGRERGQVFYVDKLGQRRAVPVKW
ncbi:MAG: ribonuclease H-like domain-containing protein [Verrucomicrobiae bacterium]|nr:ribonuclease H-like domain-containing protein [Verrucomicrobiae bacterium]